MESENGQNKEGKKTCFVIAPIGDEGSEYRIWSDKVLRHIIQPCVTELGYEPIRADKMDKPGMITNQVIRAVIDSQLVIADLTFYNPNVMYELSIRHATKKPLVQLISKDWKIPFDINQTRTIQFLLSDPDSIVAAKEQLISQIKSIESNWTDADNPISVTLKLELLKESQDPTQRSLADILQAISDLRTEIRGVRVSGQPIWTTGPGPGTYAVQSGTPISLWLQPKEEGSVKFPSPDKTSPYATVTMPVDNMNELFRRTKAEEKESDSRQIPPEGKGTKKGSK